MNPEFVVRPGGPNESERVGLLVYELLTELYPGEEHQRSAFVDAASTLLTGNEGVWSYLATMPAGRDVGVVTLNECAAINWGGRFGEICELYVVPEFRSKGVGGLLIEAAISFGHERGWFGIEVGAPSAPTWQRTIDFYRRQGFEEVGPRLDLTLRRSG